MDYAASLTKLNIRIGDTANTTFTPEEKEDALQKAWNDSFVVTTVYDSTTVWAASTFTYSIPATLRTVKDVYTQQSAANGAEPIASDLWEVVDGNIQFRTNASRIFNAGDTVYLKGNYKLNYLTDTLDTENLQEYVIASAGFNTLTSLAYKKANLFLKNDTTMSEVVTLRRELDAERKELRGKLLREAQGA